MDRIHRGGVGRDLLHRTVGQAVVPHVRPHVQGILIRPHFQGRCPSQANDLVGGNLQRQWQWIFQQDGLVVDAILVVEDHHRVITGHQVVVVEVRDVVPLQFFDELRSSGAIDVELDGERTLRVVGVFEDFNPDDSIVGKARRLLLLHFKGKAWRHRHHVRGLTVVEAHRLHKQGELNRSAVERVHGGLRHVGIHQVLGRLPFPIEAARAGRAPAAHTPFDGLKVTEACTIASTVR